MAIHDVGMDGALAYMVCEYVDGEPLADRLRRAPALATPAALKLLIDMLEALAEAHRHGVVHRDLKPDNVLMTRDGHPKICDFGLARVQDLASATTAGFIQGTPPFMAPEQCRGDRTGPAADLYAVGVIAFLIFTGQLPFRGPTVPAFLYQHVHEPAPPLRTFVPTLPASLDAAVARALAKAPRERFGGAAEFAAALRAVAAGASARVAMPVPEMAPPRRAGRELGGRYVLVRLVRQDDASEQWLALDSASGAEVLVTLHEPGLWADPVRAASVVAEAHMAMSLDHPGIARLLGVQQGAEPFVVSQHVAGLTLAEVLARRRSTGGRGWAPAEALPLVDALAAALDHAHQSGVLHRDVNPGSIVLAAPGLTPVLMDAAFGAEVSRWRRRGGAPAPPGWPPEQAQGAALDPRADVYGLAAVVHELLTLAPPAGPTTAEDTHGGLAAVAGVPWEVAQVLDEALAADRNVRPVRAGLFAEKYRAAVDAVAARQAAARIRTPPRSRPAPVPAPAAEKKTVRPVEDHEELATQALWHWAFALALAAWLAISSLELPDRQRAVGGQGGQDAPVGGPR